MQDRFKLRIWNKLTNEMQDVISINYNPEFPDSSNIIAETNSFDKVKTHNMPITCANSFNNIILMQCTGLKDKYGKLIYDGDLLDLYVSSKRLYRYPVKFEMGSFMLVSQDEIFDFRNKWNDNVYPLSQLYFEYQNVENSIWECEVIGNIYENPELLKGGGIDEI